MCIKHPNDQGGEITLTLQPKCAQEWVLLIRDNGVGIPDNTDLLKTKSLGMTLVTTLVKQIKARLEWQSDHGLEVQIICALPAASTSWDK